MQRSAPKSRASRSTAQSRIPVLSRTQQPTKQKAATPRRRARSPPPPPPPPQESSEEEEQLVEEEDEEQLEESASEQEEESAAQSAAAAAAEDSVEEESAEPEEEEKEEQEDEADIAEDAEDDEALGDEDAEKQEHVEDAEEEAEDAEEEEEDEEDQGEEEDPDSDRLQGNDDAAGEESSTRSRNAALAGDEYAQALARRGVIYVSRVPPYMKAAKLRWLLEQLLPKHKKRARLGRIFLTPEDAAVARKRKKGGGNSGARFVDGWVEFESKKIARWLAETYNTRPMGGPRRSRYREDLWNLKYLSGFKWSHLTEKIAYDKQVRGTRIREEMSQAKRESEHYLAQVEASKKSQQIAEKRSNKRKGDVLADSESQPQRKRNFHQRSFIDQRFGGAAKK